MFKKLFGGKEKKEDPKVKEEIEKKKNQFEIKMASEEIHTLIETNQSKIRLLDNEIMAKKQVSSSAGPGSQEGRGKGQGHPVPHRDKGQGVSNRQAQQLHHSSDEEQQQSRRCGHRLGNGFLL